MTKQVQIRRGTDSQHTSFTGAEGEISVNTTNDSVHVHDGTTAGGKEMARADGSNVAFTSGTIDGTVIGGTTPAAGTFTTLTASGDVNFDSNTLFVDASANAVGIGTNAPDTPLEISVAGSGATNVLKLTTTGEGTVPSIVFEGDQGGTQHVAARIRAGQEDASNGNIIFEVEDAGSLDEAIRIMSDGSVGIGTSSPTSFDAAGDNLVVGTGSGNNGMTIYSGSSNAGSLFFADGTSTAAEKADGYIQYEHNNQALVFATGGGSAAARFDASGNLLVGKATANSATDGVQLLPNGISAFGRDSAEPLRLNRNGTDGEILRFQKAGATVGSIGTLSGYITIGRDDTAIVFQSAENNIQPFNQTTNSGRDAAIDLGKDTVRFKDLYLSGSVYLGGTGSANALDDYEEGSFTPTYLGSSSSPTITYDGSTSGKYTKIGRQVIADIIVRTDSVSGGSGSVYIGGLPFTADAHGASRAGTLNVGYCSQWTGSYPQAGYINDGHAFVVLTVNASDDARSGIDQNPQVSNMQTGTNDNFIMATLFYTV